MSPGSGMMRLSAVRGWHTVSANFIGTWSVKSQWETHLDECEKQNVEPDPSRWRVARSVYVAETDAEAEAFVKRKAAPSTTTTSICSRSSTGPT